MSDGNGERVLQFERGGVCHAVVASSVRGVAPRTAATRVPGTPPELRGVVAWRGRVLPVVEPGEVLSTAWSAVVIVAGESGDMAFVADHVEGWVPRGATLSVLDIDEIQRRLHDRIHRGSDDDPTENS